MKNLPGIFRCPLRVAVLLAGMLLAGWSAALAQSKKFSETYTVSPGASLSINNQFGNVVIHAWNKNQVQANVDVLVEHGNERKAQELLNAIQIVASGGGNGVSLRTSIGKDKLNLNGNTSMRINYQVYVPAGINLDLVNKFGNTTLPDLTGSTDVRQSFGNLETGSLSGERNRLSIEFSEGSTRIGPVKNLEADFKFSNISIARLTGQAEIRARHCGKFVLAAGQGLNGLELDADYSDVAIELIEDFDGKFDVSTNFGDFRYDDRTYLNQPADGEEHRGPRFRFDYTGTIGEGGSCLLTIDSDFSTITFR